MAASMLLGRLSCELKRFSLCEKLIARCQQRIHEKRFMATEASDDTTEFNDETEFEPEVEDFVDTNVSNLRPNLRRMALNLPPEDVPEPFASDKRFLRKAYGRYGSVTGLDPALYCWPTPEEIKTYMLVEQTVESSLQDRLQKELERKEKEEIMLQTRIEKIDKAMEKMPKLIAAHNKKIQKVELEAEKKKKEMLLLLEEAQVDIGSSLTIKDPRFKKFVRDKKAKEALEKQQKKKEQKKLQKAKKAGLASAAVDAETT